jgi:hypothetical protein
MSNVMNTSKALGAITVLLIAWSGNAMGAAEDSPPAPNPNRREELRESLKDLSPEERKARIREMRERGEGPFRDEAQRRREALRNMPPEERQAKLKVLGERAGVTNRADFKELRQELRSLPPSERAARIRELREKAGPSPLFSDEERQVRRKEIRQRLNTQIEQLRRKKSDGSISEAEARRLQRLEKIATPAPDDGDKAALPVPR